jgi:hypothetical protein
VRIGNTDSHANWNSKFDGNAHGDRNRYAYSHAVR